MNLGIFLKAFGLTDEDAKRLASMLDPNKLDATFKDLLQRFNEMERRNVETHAMLSRMTRPSPLPQYEQTPTGAAIDAENLRDFLRVNGYPETERSEHVGNGSSEHTEQRAANGSGDAPASAAAH